MEQRIFLPLKMTDTAFWVPSKKAHRIAAIYERDRDTGRLEEAKTIFGGPMPSYLSPPDLESAGAGLLSTTMDYARFAQMLANKGELDGVRLLSPASVELMGTNVLPQDIRVRSNGIGFVRFSEAIGFGLDVMVAMNPRAAGTLEGRGTVSWGGAAGTWWWMDPENDVIFVLMTQYLGNNQDDSLSAMARTLTYQALVNPHK